MTRKCPNAAPALIRHVGSYVDIVQTERGTEVSLVISGSDENESLTGTCPIHLFPEQARSLARRLIARADEIQGTES